jgi:hypothetical protein
VKPENNAYGIIFTNDLCEDTGNCFRIEMNSRQITVFGLGDLIECQGRFLFLSLRILIYVPGLPLSLHSFSHVAIVRLGSCISIFIHGIKVIEHYDTHVHPLLISICPALKS